MHENGVVPRLYDHTNDAQGIAQLMYVCSVQNCALYLVDLTSCDQR